MNERVALPVDDATSDGLSRLLAANAVYRSLPWPAPFDATTLRLRMGDARDLSWIADASVHLVVTSPPYWTLKAYVGRDVNAVGHALMPRVPGRRLGLVAPCSITFDSDGDTGRTFQ